MGCFGFLLVFFLIFLDENRVRAFFGGLTNFKIETPLHAHVPRISKVINFRLCRIGRETFSAKTSFGHRALLLRMAVLVSNIPQPRGGDLFLNLCSGFSTSFCVLLQSSYIGGLYRILFELLMNGGRWFEFLVPFGRTGAVRRSQTRAATVRLCTSAITFLLLDQERVSNDEPEEVGCEKT